MANKKTQAERHTETKEGDITNIITNIQKFAKKVEDFLDKMIEASDNMSTIEQQRLFKTTIEKALTKLFPYGKPADSPDFPGFNDGWNECLNEIKNRANALYGLDI